MSLLPLGFLAGLLTIVSPCILPVLPAVVASGVSTGGRRRAFAIATGLAIAFGASALLSIRILDALHLPLDFRKDLAEVALFVLAASFLVPQLGELFERAFARISFARSPNTDRSGFVLGATLGLLYLPCGGPILSAITAVGQKNGHFGADAVGLTIAYSLGIAVPVFVLVLLTSRMTGMTTWLRAHGPQVRRAGGVLVLASAVLIATGVAANLQTHTPEFAASIENHYADRSGTHDKLEAIANPHESTATKKLQRNLATKKPTSPAFVPMADQVPMLKASDLPVYGDAPNFAGITHWFNTPGGKPLTLQELRGKVVLIDFWTYSCINCRRSLPHVEAWYQRYRNDGLVVVGVHTPEFDFEHVESNVAAAVKSLGVTYPVAMDNDYGTWNAWANESWPAEYLIDQQGRVRYGDVGEGDYGQMEAAIRALLAANGAKLPAPTSVADRTPDEQTTPESYLGYERLARYRGSPSSVVHNTATPYAFASSLSPSQLSYNGTWTVESQDILAGNDAELRIDVDAKDVYLVLGGTGTVTATLNGRPLATQHVSGVPTLYTLLSSQSAQKGVLQLDISPGVRAYDFTFG